MGLTQCGYVTSKVNRQLCIVGIAEDKAWDGPGIASATSYCSSVQDTQDRESCQNLVLSRIQSILPIEEQLSYCQKLPVMFSRNCGKSG
jgi:hypothetical protein